MEIQRNTGNKIEKWIISYKGYCWYESYGSSMTDWASFYTIDKLLELKTMKDIHRFEKSLPKEIGSLKKLMKLLISEIEKEKEKRAISKELLEVIEKVPLIENKIKSL